MARTINHRALAALKDKFPGIGLKVGEFRDMVTVVVPREHIKAVVRFLRDDPAMRYDQLFELNGVDYLNFPGASDRFAVNYGLLSTTHNDRIWLKVFLNPTLDTAPGNAPLDSQALAEGDPGLKIDTVIDLFAVADWMEREVYDMLGILFVGHPDLRRILTWNGFKSYPLRKDYPLRGVGEREDYKIVTRDSA